MSTQADVISAIQNLTSQANALLNAVNVPLSSLTVFAAQASASAAAAIAASPTTIPTVDNNPSTIPTTSPVASEGGIVALTAPAIVKFGSPSSGKMYQKLLGAGSYLCGKEFFGDPIFGEVKYCYIKQSNEAASAPSPIIDTTQIDGSPGGSTTV